LNIVINEVNKKLNKKFTLYKTLNLMNLINVLKLQEETILTLINWEGNKKEIFLNIGSFLYHNKSQFIKKDELIAEYSTQTIIPGSRKLKPIYTSLAGEIRFENLLIRKMIII
jgi:hypothetical protein